MKENRVAEAIGQVDDRYVNEAIRYHRKKKSGVSTVMKWMATAACLCLLVGGGMFYYAGKVDSVVSIDINPSIELTVSKNDKVLSAVPLNEDAEIVLEGMDLKKVDLETAVNAIIGSLVKNGYMNEVYNAINVCVENDDTKRADEISNKIKAEINDIMAEKDLIGSVNSQSCPVDEKLQALAQKYGVSVGKLTLAQQVSENMDISLEIAVKLTISELWDLLEAEDVELLSKDDVVNIAVKDAGIDATKMVLTSVKIKETSGVYTYDVKFTVDDTAEYKYKIDAVKGTILEFEYKFIIKKEPVTPPQSEKQITKIEALNFAYADAKVDAANAKLEELTHRPKEKEYYIEFTVGLFDYIYVINGLDGSVISKEVIESVPVVDEPEEVPPGAVTSIEDALKLALAKAGVKQEDLTMCDIKYHVKKEGPEYKVHFHVDKEHYEYVINALTGECVEKKRPEPPTPPHEKEPKPTPEPKPTHEPKPTKEPKPAPDPKPTKEPKPAPEIKPTPEPKHTPVPPTEKEKPVPPHEKEAEGKPTPKKPEGPAAHKEEAAKPAPKQAPKPAGPNDTKVTIELVESNS